MKTSCFSLLALVGSIACANAQKGVDMEVNLYTGSDDLRSSNNALLKINFRDNTSSREYNLGGGFGQNTNVLKKLTLDFLIDITQVRSVTIRHDGSPKNVFDTYDNWDLQAVEISLRDEDNGGQPVALYNSASDQRRSRFVTRFTGDNRSVILYNQFRARQASVTNR